MTGDPLTDGIEQAVRRDRVAHHAERVEIARGGRAAQVGATAHVGNSASERKPVEPPIARASAEDLETVRVVEGHFHAQQTSRFVVHLDRIFIEPVADADPFGPMDQRAVGLALKSSGHHPSQEAQQVTGREMLDGVMQQPGIDRPADPPGWQRSHRWQIRFRARSSNSRGTGSAGIEPGIDRRA